MLEIRSNLAAALGACSRLSAAFDFTPSMCNDRHFAGSNQYCYEFLFLRYKGLWRGRFVGTRRVLPPINKRDNKMIKKLSLFCLLAGAALTSIFAQADDHTSPQNAVTSIVSFSTQNPAQVVGALTKFSQTDCRKNAPVSIRLMADIWNGTETNTHSVLMTFASPNDMAATFGAFAQCAPWQELMALSAQNSTPHSQYVVRPLVAGGDVSKDGAYTVWQMRVENEVAYAEAFEALMQEQVKNGDLNGAYGLWRVVGGADQEVTHISFAGAANLPELLSGSLQPTKAVQKFYSEVGELRSVTRQVMNTVVGDF